MSSPDRSGDSSSQRFAKGYVQFVDLSVRYNPELPMRVAAGFRLISVRDVRGYYKGIGQKPPAPVRAVRQ